MSVCAADNVEAVTGRGYIKIQLSVDSESASIKSGGFVLGTLGSLQWSLSPLGEDLEALPHKAGLSRRHMYSSPPPKSS